MSAVITSSGTFVPWARKPSTEGDGIVRGFNQQDLETLNNSKTDKEGQNELLQMVGLYAVANGITPNAAAHEMHRQLGAMLAQSDVETRAFP
jgi:hypothetical protein